MSLPRLPSPAPPVAPSRPFPTRTASLIPAGVKELDCRRYHRELSECPAILLILGRLKPPHDVHQPTGRQVPETRLRESAKGYDPMPRRPLLTPTPEVVCDPEAAALITDPFRVCAKPPRDADNVQGVPPRLTHSDATTSSANAIATTPVTLTHASRASSPCS